MRAKARSRLAVAIIASDMAALEVAEEFPPRDEGMEPPTFLAAFDAFGTGKSTERGCSNWEIH